MFMYTHTHNLNEFTPFGLTMLPQTIDYLITPHGSHGEPLSRGDQEPPPQNNVSYCCFL